jgi:hypothetical protein
MDVQKLEATENVEDPGGFVEPDGVGCGDGGGGGGSLA